MADNADRKPLYDDDDLPSDASVSRQNDPLLELSLIADWDETPARPSDETADEAPPEGAAEEAPVAEEEAPLIDEAAPADEPADLPAFLTGSARPEPDDVFAPPGDEANRDASARAPFEPDRADEDEPDMGRAAPDMGPADDGPADDPHVFAAPTPNAEPGKDVAPAETEADAPSAQLWAPAEPATDLESEQPADDDVTDLAASMEREFGLDDTESLPEPAPVMRAWPPATSAPEPGLPDPDEAASAPDHEAAVEPAQAAAGEAGEAPNADPFAAVPMQEDRAEAPSLEDELTALLAGTGPVETPMATAEGNLSEPHRTIAGPGADPAADTGAEPPAEPSARDEPIGHEPSFAAASPEAPAFTAPDATEEESATEAPRPVWLEPMAGGDGPDGPPLHDDEPVRDADGPAVTFSRATPVPPDLAERAEAPAAPEPDAAPDTALEDEFAAALDAELNWDDIEAPPLEDLAETDSDVAPLDAASADRGDPAIEAEPIDPVDELAAIMGLERTSNPDEPFAPIGRHDMAADDDASAYDAQDDRPAFLAAGSGAPTAGDNEPAPAHPAPPVLDTVDMSDYERAETADFAVPDFDPPAEDRDTERAFAALEDELSTAFDEDAFGQPESRPAAAAAPVAAGATLGNGFDHDQFEADLARDMEFVGHDRLAARGGETGVDGEPAEGRGDAPADAGRSRRGMVIGAVVAGLALAGIAGVLVLSGGGADETAGPVLVEADPEPVKVEPDDPGGTTVPNQDRAVFADGETAAPAQEDLVSTAEEPVDIATAPVAEPPAETAAPAAKAEDRLTDGGTETTSGGQVAPITPRRVRTLIVRPDGTLEERAPAPQPEAEPTPQVAAAPAGGNATAEADAEPAEALTAAPAVSAPETVAGLPVPDETGATTPAAAEGAPADSAATPVETTETTAATEADDAPVVVRRVQTTSATPAAIRDRPAGQPVNVVNRQQNAAAPAATTPAQPAATQPATAEPTISTAAISGFSVQLAALPTEEAARATATRLSEQYGSLLAGRGLSIQRAVIDGRGTFYRVRVAADGSGDANSLCNDIKAAGGNCFVAR